LKILKSYISIAASTVVEIVVDGIFSDLFRQKALESLELLTYDAVEVKFHGIYELGLILLVEDVNAIWEFALDRADKLRHSGVLLSL
jgi:hypothetical protein